MSKKAVGFILIFIPIILLVIGGSYYFLVRKPAEEKKQIETFYNDISSFTDLKNKVTLIESSIEAEPAQKTISKGFAETEFTGLSELFIKLANELNNSEPPEELEDNVAELVADLNLISDDIKNLEQVLIYLSNISSVINTFSENSAQYNSSLDTFNSENIDTIIADFNKSVSELNRIYEEFLTQAGQLEVPESAIDFHKLVISSFTELQSTTTSIFDELANTLAFTSRVINSPGNLSAAEYARAQNISAELDSTIARFDEIGSQGAVFDSQEIKDLFDLESFDEDFEKTLFRINSNLKVLEDYKTENL